MRQIQQKLLARSTSKQMIACFVGRTGHVAIVPLQQSRTVNSEWYTTSWLSVVFQDIRKTKSRRQITFHHENTSSPTSAQTTAFLSTQSIDLMSHPPYGPDLALNDFFLFLYVKIKWEVNVFRHLKKRLMRSECMFWRCLNQSGKSASTIGLNACKSV